MGRKVVRTIGVARAKFKIGMMSLGYNISVSAQPTPSVGRVCKMQCLRDEQ
jgi:hypothetical protein